MSNTIVSSTTIPNPTGHATQVHAIYATHSARWWLFYVASSSAIGTYYSSDGVTWTAGTSITVTSSVSDGRSLHVTYDNLGSVDVVHVTYNYTSGGFEEKAHVRATISGTSITWETAAVIDGGSDDNYGIAPMGDAHILDTNGRVWLNTGLGGTVGGDTGIYESANADTGGSWTNTWGSLSIIDNNQLNGSYARAMVALASGHVLSLTTDGLENSGTNVASEDIVSKLYNGSTWGTRTSVFGGGGTAEAANDWGVVKLSNTDVHAVRRTGTNTYSHKRFNGTSWSAGQTIPTQTSLGNGGLAMFSDGTSVWLVVIDSAAGNHVRYIQWTSGAWGTWTDLETSSATRNDISIAREAGSGNALVIWTEGAASPWAIKSALLSIGGGGTTWTGAATLSGGLDQTAAAVVSYAASSALAGSLDLAAAGVRLYQALSTLSGELDMAAAGSRSANASASLSGALDVVSDAVRTFVAEAALSGDLDLTAVSAALRSGAASLSGSLSLTASAAGRILLGAAALAGQGDLSSAAVLTLAAASALTGDADLTAQAAMTLVAQADLASALDLSAIGLIAGANGADLSFHLSMLANATVTYAGAASLSGSATLVARGARTFAAAAVLSGALDLSASGLRTIGASANLSGQASLDVLAALHLAGRAAMAAGLDVSVLAGLTLVGAAALEGSLTLTADAASGIFIVPLATVLLEAALSVSLALESAPQATIVLESSNDGSVE